MPCQARDSKSGRGRGIKPLERLIYIQSNLTFFRAMMSPSHHGKGRQEARGNPSPRTSCGHSFGVPALLWYNITRTMKKQGERKGSRIMDDCFVCEKPLAPDYTFCATRDIRVCQACIEKLDISDCGGCNNCKPNLLDKSVDLFPFGAQLRFYEEERNLNYRKPLGRQFGGMP